MMFFFFNDTATTEIYTLSLHDALPIFACAARVVGHAPQRFQVHGPGLRLGSGARQCDLRPAVGAVDRKSTRLNSSHRYISYAVFCLEKKKSDHSRTRLLRSFSDGI